MAAMMGHLQSSQSGVEVNTLLYLYPFLSPSTKETYASRNLHPHAAAQVRVAKKGAGAGTKTQGSGHRKVNCPICAIGRGLQSSAFFYSPKKKKEEKEMIKAVVSMIIAILERLGK